jgi:hypothetical protein
LPVIAGLHGDAAELAEQGLLPEPVGEFIPIRRHRWEFG